MSISSLSSNTILVEITQSNPYLNGMNKNANFDMRIGSNNFSKQVSLDQRNIVVSEKTDNTPGLIPYNFGLQRNVPVPKTKRPAQSFNETASIQEPDYSLIGANENTDDGNQIIKNYVNETKENTSYYYIIENSNSSNKQKSLEKNLSEVQRKINSIYQLNRRREPGNLVNILV